MNLRIKVIKILNDFNLWLPLLSLFGTMKETTMTGALIYKKWNEIYEVLLEVPKKAKESKFFFILILWNITQLNMKVYLLTNHL